MVNCEVNVVVKTMVMKNMTSLNRDLIDWLTLSMLQSKHSTLSWCVFMEWSGILQLRTSIHTQLLASYYSMVCVYVQAIANKVMHVWQHELLTHNYTSNKSWDEKCLYIWKYFKNIKLFNKQILFITVTY